MSCKHTPPLVINNDSPLFRQILITLVLFQISFFSSNYCRIVPEPRWCTWCWWLARCHREACKSVASRFFRRWSPWFPRRSVRSSCRRTWPSSWDSADRPWPCRGRLVSCRRLRSPGTCSGRAWVRRCRWSRPRRCWTFASPADNCRDSDSCCWSSASSADSKPRPEVARIYDSAEIISS